MGREMGWSTEGFECQEEALILSTAACRPRKGCTARPPSLVCRKKSCELKIKGLQGLNAAGPPFLGLPQQALVTGISCFRSAPWGWGGGGGAGFCLFVGSALASDSPAPCPLHPVAPISGTPRDLYRCTPVPRKRVVNWPTFPAFFAWYRAVMVGDLQAKGKCLGADLHMGEMPAQL